MSEGPWLTIVGLGEDGPDGLPAASRAALDAAEVVIGPPRHLALLPDLVADRMTWPVPFSKGLDLLESYRGRRVVALASGDPFWFGAGRVIAERLSPQEWCAHPGVSTFALAASRMGWAIERTLCLGLHAAPLTRLRPHLAPGARLLVLLRGGEAVPELSRYLTGTGFGRTRVTVLEALGGPRERRTEAHADALTGAFGHPVCVALEITGGLGMPCVPGREDDVFESDGQISKRPVRALTLSALAPRAGERLWDIGGGSGSIAIEWLLAHPTTEAVSIEARVDRATCIVRNADALGVDRLNVVQGAAPEALEGLAPPDAVFVGGGLSRALLDDLVTRLAPGTRLVANAVTLESEALLAAWHAERGGDLMRIELAEAAPLGPRRGWRSSYPVVQYRGAL
ncbi:precorrin-6y methyltransferase [Roseivivax halodurans JCM 10272]|uniref:Precorrin-6y methyltransferase n=1 Tax=Roseivivax halodurans JCM 10272 TaxID=1449350 RepID=X7ECJ9_9RHOB|nr:bifunctional cobalt-precorrin-7 (C(5))-methyltransferase/cobalt-precorrin-6B (C(15))-methyltransferase [Roseivivax halodurans]ETX13677.1 precorrin-6y methyltransferase [Roseivivax halodurans JCM 10272]